jgi:hypothetical protein
VSSLVDGEKAKRSLFALRERIVRAIDLTLRAAVDATEASAKGSKLFKDQTGGTRESIQGRVTGFSGFVRAEGAMRFLENGTAPHLIVAHGGTLRFSVGGQTIFRKMVRHPGTHARPVMHEARERGVQAAEYGAEFYVGAAIRASNR